MIDSLAGGYSPFIALRSGFLEPQKGFSLLNIQPNLVIDEGITGLGFSQLVRVGRITKERKAKTEQAIQELELYRGYIL